jgi:predicted secreted protein
MALVSPASGELLVLQLGNGATPEVFTATCTINTSRSLDLSAKASSAELADCVTPSNPASMIRQVQSTDWKFSGSGVVDAPSIQALLNWFTSGAQKNVKVIQNKTGAAGGFTLTGPAVCTSMQLTGQRGEQQTFTMTVECAGQYTVAANP